jgi:hypothetical protein
MFIQFKIRVTNSISLIYVLTLLGIIKFYVVDVNTLFLLCLVDINYLRVYYNNVKNILVILTNELLIV